MTLLNLVAKDNLKTIATICRLDLIEAHSCMPVYKTMNHLATEYTLAEAKVSS